ncbi:MAG TPA: hypothetical protein VI197_09125 [Polyangiaceae bacterium]
MHRLFDLRMADGSRHFGELPETHDPQEPEWHRLGSHVSGLAGAALTGFVTDDVTEAWIAFTLAGQQFSLNNQQSQWWFFVNDPSCPDELLLLVLDHFEGLLNPRGAIARRFGPIAGAYRVMVYEEDGRVTFKDFAERGAAEGYADDAAFESGLTLAQVFDQDLRLIHFARCPAMPS